MLPLWGHDRAQGEPRDRHGTHGCERRRQIDRPWTSDRSNRTLNRTPSLGCPIDHPGVRQRPDVRRSTCRFATSVRRFGGQRWRRRSATMAPQRVTRPSEIREQQRASVQQETARPALGMGNERNGSDSSCGDCWSSDGAFHELASTPPDRGCHHDRRGFRGSHFSDGAFYDPVSTPSDHGRGHDGRRFRGSRLSDGAVHDPVSTPSDHGHPHDRRRLWGSHFGDGSVHDPVSTPSGHGRHRNRRGFRGYGLRGGHFRATDAEHRRRHHWRLAAVGHGRARRLRDEPTHHGRSLHPSLRRARRGKTRPVEFHRFDGGADHPPTASRRRVHPGATHAGACWLCGARRRKGPGDEIQWSRALLSNAGPIGSCECHRQEPAQRPAAGLHRLARLLSPSRVRKARGLPSDS